jgi:phage-related protein
MVRAEPAKPKPDVWMGSSRKDLKSFPEDVQAHVGYSLYGAQCGEEYASVKALKGSGGRSVLEIVAPHEGDTYRAVYTVKFVDAIDVLHAFQNKSKSGIATPKTEINLIRRRLADAERLHTQRRK